MILYVSFIAELQIYFNSWCPLILCNSCFASIAWRVWRQLCFNLSWHWRLFETLHSVTLMRRHFCICVYPVVFILIEAFLIWGVVMLLPFIDYTVVSLHVSYNIHVYYMMFRVPYTVVLPFPPLQNWSRDFQSCDIHPCKFGPVFSGPAFSTPAICSQVFHSGVSTPVFPAFSAPPLICQYEQRI